MNATRIHKRRTALFVLAIAVLVAGAGCGNSGAGPAATPEVSAADARHYVEDFYREWGGGAETLDSMYRTLDEVLPNVSYVRPSGSSVAATHVVVGTITEVVRGKGFRVDGDDAPRGTETQFDDARAMWWTAHATVAVDRCLGCSTPGEIAVQVPAGGPTDFAKLRSGLKNLGKVVIFLRDESPVSDYDPSLYWVIHDKGLLVATVAADGALALPLIFGNRAAKLLARTPRLADLEASAATTKAIPIVPDPRSPSLERRADGQ